MSAADTTIHSDIIATLGWMDIWICTHHGHMYNVMYMSSNLLDITFCFEIDKSIILPVVAFPTDLTSKYRSTNPFN